MSKANHLFYSTDPEKQTLHRRIVPNSDQYKMQQERWNDLKDHLISDLNELSGCAMTSWIQGSYKFGTQTRPVNPKDDFDIDLGIFFSWSGSKEDNKFEPLEIKKMVQKSLYSYVNSIDDLNKDNVEIIEPPKKRCSRIRFKNDLFHIDVPTYHLNSDDEKITLATENNEWENSDPKAFYEWFYELYSDEDCSQIRRIIKYLKIWASLHLEKPPSSILLTVLIAEEYINMADNEKNGDDICLKNISKKIIDRLDINSEVKNPVDENEDLNRLTENEFTIFIGKLNVFYNLAVRALSATTEMDTVLIWSKLFSHFFPVPENTTNKALIRVDFIPKVSVVATSKDNSNFSKRGNQDGIFSIPRNCDIKFEITNLNELPQGASCRWMVRNEEEEAEYKNDLGHFAGSGFKAEESSAYKGTHYMDLSVLSYNGILIGFQRIPVEITGSYIPPRNSLKKPFYRKKYR